MSADERSTSGGSGTPAGPESLDDTVVARRAPDGTVLLPELKTPSGLPAFTTSPEWRSLASRYVVLDELGRGGMGTVRAAYDTRLDRRVALKLMRLQEDEKGASLQVRMLREAQAMARLSHPNAVAVYDAGTLQDDTVFIAMELVEGQTLRQWCLPGRPWREVLGMFVAAARGLAAAHTAGLVHRDFKPENVLVGKDGRPRVTDFGLARAAAPPRLEPGAVVPQNTGSDTDHGLMVGTPAYMAPEVLSGQPVDARSDLFSFCVALYEALYQKPAFPGDSIAERWEAQRQGHLNPPPETSPVPAWVAAVLRRGLSVDPTQRHASMQELITALEADPEQKRRALLRAVGLVLGMGALVALAFTWGTQERVDCQQMERRLAGVWDAPLRQQLRKALLATGLSYAESTAERVQAALDGYAGEWSRLRTEVCEASRGSDEGQRDLITLQVSCLERRRAQLGSVVKLLSADSSPEMLSQAAQAVQLLPPLEECANAQALTTAVPMPREPEARARAEELQAKVDRLESMWMAGKFQEGLELGREVLPEVEALDHAPLRAQALYHLGRLQGAGGHFEQADALLRQALVQAARAKDDVLLARLWNMLIWNSEVRMSRSPNVLDTETVLLETAVERAGDDLARAESLHILGGVLYKVGRLEDALGRFQQAAVLMEKVLGPEHPFVAAMHNNAGVVLTELGRFEEARASYDRALQMTQKALGRDHPEVGNTLTGLGRALVRVGQLDEAEQHLRRGLSISEKALGPRHPQVAEALLGLGEVAVARGRPADALAPLRRALDEVNPPERAELQFMLARALEAAGQESDRARSLANEALAHYRAIGNKPRSEEVSRWLEEHSRISLRRP
ncbi:serine/threonine-protein kinase [Hyalangium versicolor]|uniref:serine/threonine-protein kinase n=1 Tax=Hyalangium versicolor TaxID=2861190 RepID=UPI002815C875|nr:serine/threonine-protein kinase [Hyalangium versicolor]